MDTRISLGIAFLRKIATAQSVEKKIIHAEYLIKSKKFLITRMSFVEHPASLSDVKTTELWCANLLVTLRKLTYLVNSNVEDRFEFDPSGMEMLEEIDESTCIKAVQPTSRKDSITSASPRKRASSKTHRMSPVPATSRRLRSLPRVVIVQ